MTFLLLKIAGLMVLAAGFGAWVARWFFRHRYEDVTVQYTGWQNEWAQWRKGLDSKLSLRQMIDLSPVTERLNELESLVRGFGMPKPPPVDLEPVLQAVRDIRVPDAPTYDFTPLYSRRSTQIVAAQITVPPIKLEWLGMSVNSSQPIKADHTRSRNLADCVAEMSAAMNERVRQ